jgi:hypothetical protein
VDVAGATTAGALVAISITAGTGTAGAVLTCTGGLSKAAAAAVAFNNCTVNEAGSAYTLTATEVQDAATPVTSSAFTVTLGAAHLAFEVQPTSDTLAGTGDFSPEVEIEDSTNTQITMDSLATDTVSLTIASGPAGATLTCGPAAMTGGDTGAGFDTCTINLAGTYTLEATDTTTSFVAVAFSDPFTIIPNTPNKLVFVTSPALNSTVGLSAAGFPAGSPTFPVSVAVEDLYGNVITSGAGSGDTVEVEIDENPPVASRL